VHQQAIEITYGAGGDDGEGDEESSVSLFSPDSATGGASEPTGGGEVLSGGSIFSATFFGERLAMM